MTYDKLVESMANYAGKLAMENKTYLILSHPENTEGTKSGAQWRNVPRSELISAILFEEFSSGGPQAAVANDFDFKELEN